MPQTVFDVGDPITSRLKLGITPGGDTAVTVKVYRPDGTAIADPAISAWGGAAGDEKTAQWYATDDGTAGAATGSADGDWLAVWKVTGAGAGTQAKVYNVRALATASDTRPLWAPFLSDVADYIPTRTLDITVPGSALFLGTFNGNTTPTDEQAQRHIDKAVASILATLGAVLPAAEPLARTVASLRAAASIERAYPDRDAQVNTAEQLDARANAELRQLITANAGGSTDTALLPQWAFPDPVSYGDDAAFY